MSKRLTYREQLDKARQQAVVAGLREAARLAADGAFGDAYDLVDEAFAELARLVAVDAPVAELEVTKVDHETKTITIGAANG